MLSVRIEEAKELLEALGMPRPQRNDNAAYTLLAFANMGPDTSWSDAQAPRLRPHDVLRFARERYAKIYAENTRETIRRQAIHQLVQGGVLERNPGAAGLATNSPRTCYALTAEALSVIRTFATPAFSTAASSFLQQVGGGLAARYAAGRRAAGVRLILPGGDVIGLSPGAHNQLQASVIAEFVPRFAAGAQILYLGDTDHKSLVVDRQGLSEAGVPMTTHDKLPDIVLRDPVRQWLFLIEAVTSHGPIGPKRHIELTLALERCPLGRVYVSAFPTFKEFKRHAQHIAWETEVWIAEAPDHLLHYNGDRFFGPR